MISFAAPIFTNSSTITNSPPQNSPTSTRSRRIAILPPPPTPEPPSSPPVPARSPLRPTPRTPDAQVAAPDPALSKRKHALTELLSSERAYASDLALIRDIHIPLALGQPAPFLSSSPSHTTPPPSPQVPPMTKDDTRIIFGNVEELAVFSEVFCDKLEEALQGVLDPDGDGEDRVGELFLSMIPHMKPPYTIYITKHPSAVAHLNALPQTPALTAYLAQTHTLAQSYTHAWDLPSLLIKPVQRLLKYPLLLSAIMDDTEPGQARDKLREARDKVEEVARGVNEGRRRWEVVKNLLDGKHPPPVRLKSMKALKHRTESKDDQGQLERLEKRLHICETFVREFAKDIVDWTMSLRDAITQLECWSTTFGRVIGLGQAHGSEALDLFTDIISSQITPIWISLDVAIQTTLLPKLARLLATTAQPLLLFEHMHALRPQHLQLLDAPISKARPPNSLVDASQSYLALEAQLRSELPRYITLLERGFTGCLGQFADWQARFWKEVRAQWVELWDALGVEGDMTAGAADTVKVWWERWEEVDAAATKLGITKPGNSRAPASTGSAAALATAFVAGPAPAMSLSSDASSPSSPPALPNNHRQSMQSIDLELDMYILNDARGGLGSQLHDIVVTSPDSYASYGTRPGRGSDDISVSKKETGRRRESDRPSTARQNSNDGAGSAKRNGERIPIAKKPSDRINTVRYDSENRKTVRRDSDRPSTGRPEHERPTTARPDTERHAAVPHDIEAKPMRGILKKASLDSTVSFPQPSPRLSVHTSSSSASGSSNRLSMQSIDAHVGMDMHVTQRPSSRASQLAARPYGVPPVACTGDLTSASWLPVFPGTQAIPPESSMISSQKAIPLQNEDAESRGRMLKKPSMRKRFTDAFRSPSKRPPARTSAQSLPNPELPRSPPPPPTSGTLSHRQRVIYMCTAVHPFSLPGIALPLYRSLPFLTLQAGDTLEILSEQGHPRYHKQLPIHPENEDCDDCLLLARDEQGTVGWALASFLVILS